MNNFDFGIVVGKNKNQLVVSFNSAGLCFNKNCVEALGMPKKVQIGFDLQQNLLAIKPLNENCTENAINFSYSKKTSLRGVVCSAQLRNQLLKYLPKPPRGGTKFVAKHEIAQNMLVIDLKKPIF